MDPQQADLLRTGGEKFLSSVWLVSSHNLLEGATETSHLLLKLLSIVRSYAWQPRLKKGGREVLPLETPAHVLGGLCVLPCTAVFWSYIANGT